MTNIFNHMGKERCSEIKVGIVGAGAMGAAIAYQVSSTSGMKLCWISDLKKEVAQKAIQVAGEGEAGDDFLSMLNDHPIDVLVEATNAIGAAAEYCLAAIEKGVHLVLMNAEVDLALRPLLEHKAKEKGVCVTSDAGDQHGVLAVMIEEAKEMAFDIVQAGNIKGFLDQSATPQSIELEAKKRNLSATQCCAYTDGTKLHIEMALLANAYGFLPPEGGMTGPKASHVQEALEKFDFESYKEIPRIEYLLGAEPGGGVYLVVKPQRNLPPEQAFYLNYYKLGSGPYYLLYRPYHLCHLETPKAIKRAMEGRPLLSFHQTRCEVYAHAKCKLIEGDNISHAIGSKECYGIAAPYDAELVPITLLEHGVELKNTIPPHTPIRWEDVLISDSKVFRYWKEQRALNPHV